MSAAAGYAGVLAFGWLTLFQVMLAAGLPLGRLAWGGRARILPRALRLASLVSAIAAALGGLAVAQAAGLGPALFPQIVLRPFLGAMAALFTLSFLANLFGASGAERLHGVPLALVCASSAAWLALS